MRALLNLSVNSISFEHKDDNLLEYMRGHEQLRFSSPNVRLSHLYNILVEIAFNKPANPRQRNLLSCWITCMQLFTQICEFDHINLDLKCLLNQFPYCNAQWPQPSIDIKRHMWQSFPRKNYTINSINLAS